MSLQTLKSINTYLALIFLLLRFNLLMRFFLHCNKKNQMRTLHIICTNLQARSADLPARPAGLLGRFAPSGFTLCARTRFRTSRSRKFSKKISVSQSTQNALKRIEMQKKFFTPFTEKAQVAMRNLTYPMSPTGSQGVSMPSFMPIGLKLWALEGYRQTDRATLII